MCVCVCVFGVLLPLSIRGEIAVVYPVFIFHVKGALQIGLLCDDDMIFTLDGCRCGHPVSLFSMLMFHANFCNYSFFYVCLI